MLQPSKQLRCCITKPGCAKQLTPHRSGQTFSHTCGSPLSALHHIPLGPAHHPLRPCATTDTFLNTPPCRRHSRCWSRTPGGVTAAHAPPPPPCGLVTEGQVQQCQVQAFQNQNRGTQSNCEGWADRWQCMCREVRYTPATTKLAASTSTMEFLGIGLLLAVAGVN